MIRVGLIGAGFIGRNHFNQYARLGQRAKVTVLCDQDAARRAGDWSGVGGNLGDRQGTRRDLGDIRPCTDWREVVADPDVDLIDICVPTPLHREIAVAALQAGRHVLCEKPMALTLADCDAMLEAASRAAGRFMIAQCIRFWPEYVYLREAFTDGRFGPLRALHLRRQSQTPDYSLNNWLLRPELSGGAVLDLHVHDVDFALSLFGRPQAVCARGYRRAAGSLDRIHASWTVRQDVVLQLEGFWDLHAGFGFNMGFTAAFEQASVCWDLNSGRPLTVYRTGQEPLVPALGPDDGYFGEIEYFLSCIERGEAPRASTPQESRDAVAVALAEARSAAAGGEPVAPF